MYNVAGRVVTITLSGMKELTGSQFPVILAGVGLERFIDNLPDTESDEPLATEDEMSHLYGAIYDIAGESVLRLFMRNLAYKIQQQTLKLDTFTKMKQSVMSQPAPLRLQYALEIYTEATGRWSGSPRILTMDNNNFYFKVTNCVYCKYLKHNTEKPICEFIPFLYAGILKSLTDLPYLNVLETECRKTGAAECSLTIPRITG